MPEVVDPKEPGRVTSLLAAMRQGDPTAADRLMPLVYDQLRAVAARLLHQEAQGHTLQPTALVHEAWIKLAGGGPDWADRKHFVGVAARAMRQVLVDHARRRQADKRGAGVRPVTLEGELLGHEVQLEEMIALDDALARLAARNDRLRKLVELRFFGGLTEDEAADALGVTVRTVQRDWAKARAFLYAELYDGK